MNQQVGIMKTRFLLLIAFLPGFCISGYGQNRFSGSVQGQITDSTSHQILSDASVTVTNTADSSNAGFSVTDRSGKFRITGLEKGSYRINISFQGYGMIVKSFSIDETHNQADLGTIYLKKSSQTLQEVIVEPPTEDESVKTVPSLRQMPSARNSATGLLYTFTACVSVSTQPLLDVTISVTLYGPPVAYTCEGFCAALVPPSPKFQFQPVTEPVAVDASVNVTGKVGQAGTLV